jgi:hypothetical protein
MDSGDWPESRYPPGSHLADPSNLGDRFDIRDSEDSGHLATSESRRGYEEVKSQLKKRNDRVIRDAQYRVADSPPLSQRA